jgi:SAM-dependent methyltransferase
MSDAGDALAASNAFYATFWQGAWATRFPNGDEAVRAGPLLRFLGTLAEDAGERWGAPRLLDVGCGRGWLVQLLSLYGKAEGVEPAPAAVALGRQLYPGLALRAGTLDDVLAATGFAPYDVVTCSEVLEHVPEGAQPAFAATLARAVRAGGHLLLTTPRREVWTAAGDSSSQLIEAWRSEAEVEALFRDAGFTVVDRDRMGQTSAGVAERVATRLARALGPSGAGAPFEGWRRALAEGGALYQAWCFRKG